MGHKHEWFDPNISADEDEIPLKILLSSSKVRGHKHVIGRINLRFNSLFNKMTISMNFSDLFFYLNLILFMRGTLFVKSNKTNLNSNSC